MEKKSHVELGAFSRARDISVTYIENHGVKLDDSDVKLLLKLLRDQSENSNRQQEERNMSTLLESALANRDTKSISEIINNADASILGAKGCEAAILLGSEELMTTCIQQLDEPEASFWKARAALLSGQQAEAIITCLTILNKPKTLELEVSLFRTIANGLSDLGFSDHSITLLKELLTKDCIQQRPDLTVKVLIDSFRARCRASLSVERISDSVERTVFEEVDQWREQIFALELKKWALIWQLEGSDLAPRRSELVDLTRARKINERLQNRFSPMIMSTLEALGLLCSDQNDLAHGKLTDVVNLSTSHPYCNYLALEAVQLARRYLGVDCRLAVENSHLIEQHAFQVEQLQILNSDSAFLEQILSSLQSVR